ncbi:uncharacterized protein LOC109503868 isoform X2 [Harpegnathos saltator]|uniref:uncharacterized protein LOC109503868 isoform X2 n=1 Tax=Harpegnathos saltator TaxID=610380 RepID=UPI000DBEE45A|nr:uncharacterized protein LOC109503868 isoform X2 [Harpegnathos saltator]
MSIMEEYGNMARYHTGILTLISTFGVSVFILCPFWLRIFDIVWPANEVRPHSWIHIPTEYFIDQEKYYYFIVLHTNVAFCVGSTALVAVGTTSMSYFLHICGMFKVASYRVEQAMMICKLEVGSAGSETLIHKQIVCAIDMHRKATWSIRYFISKLQVFYFLLLLCTVISISLNLFRIVTSGFDFEKLVIPCICLGSLKLYIVIANNNAQQVMDHNEDMFVTVYNVKWYNAPLRIQKMILFMLQRGSKPFYVIIGGMFIGSLESAAKLLSASMSYFTVLYSTRQNI